MRCLLDTHTLIWWWLADPSLSRIAHDAITGPDNRLLVSAVSAYEIANKVRLRQLPEMRDAIGVFDKALAQDGFEPLSLSVHHAQHAGLLPGRHRDPFDRLIAAQALIEDLVVITRDREFAAFGCKVLW